MSDRLGGRRDSQGRHFFTPSFRTALVVGHCVHCGAKAGNCAGSDRAGSNTSANPRPEGKS